MPTKLNALFRLKNTAPIDRRATNIVQNVGFLVLMLLSSQRIVDMAQKQHVHGPTPSASVQKETPIRNMILNPLESAVKENHSRKEHFECKNGHVQD
jgi:hypothetical protein